jgi:hypothetical protein
MATFGLFFAKWLAALLHANIILTFWLNLGRRPNGIVKTKSNQDLCKWILKCIIDNSWRRNRRFVKTFIIRNNLPRFKSLIINWMYFNITKVKSCIFISGYCGTVVFTFSKVETFLSYQGNIREIYYFFLKTHCEGILVKTDRQENTTEDGSWSVWRRYSMLEFTFPTCFVCCS